MAKLKVTFEGPQGCGKTRVAQVLRNELFNRGASPTDASENNWRWKEFEIEIIEKQV